jgi:MoaA/NifB/PqqE/SkfB family radical SAM enzyme
MARKVVAEIRRATRRNFRAEAVHGDVRAPDPACYITDEEIGL